MAGQVLRVSLGLMEEVTMGMLFGKEIRGLASDEFDGSEAEHRIYMCVLYGTRDGKVGNNYALSRMMNSQVNGRSIKKRPRDVNDESLVLTHPSSLKNSSGNSSEHGIINMKDINCGFRSAQAFSDAYRMNAKRLKPSSTDPSETKESISRSTKIGLEFADTSLLNTARSFLEPDCFAAHPKLQYHVVESFGQGVLSVCYVDTRQRAMGCSGIFSGNNWGNWKGSSTMIPVEAPSSTPNFEDGRASTLSGPGTSFATQEVDKASKCVDHSTNRTPSSGIVDVLVRMSSFMDFPGYIHSNAPPSERPKDVNALCSGSVNATGTRPSIEDLSTRCGSHLLCNRRGKESNISDSGIVDVLVKTASMKFIPSRAYSEAPVNQHGKVHSFSCFCHSCDSSVETCSFKDIPACLLSSRLLQGQKADESNTQDPGSIGSLVEITSTKDLSDRLRSHAIRLLVDAGWMVRTRDRNHTHFRRRDSYYKPPRGPTLFSLSKAWVACGSRLRASIPHTGSDTQDGRVWVDIDEFWGDLTNILAYIENIIKFPGNSLTLLNIWHLLDPFMAVVCIDMKLRALKHGAVVKALRSKAKVLSNNKSLYIASKAADEIPAHFVEPNSFSVGSLSHRDQPVLPYSRSKGTVHASSSNLSALQGFPDLERKFSGEHLVHRADQDLHAGSSGLKSSTWHISKEFSDARDLHLRNNNLPPGKHNYSATEQSFPIFTSKQKNSCSNELACFTENDMQNESCKEMIINNSVTTNDTPSNSVEASNQDGLASYDIQRDNVRRALSFEEQDEIGDGSNYKKVPADAYSNTIVRNEEFIEVTQQSMPADTFFILNPVYLHPPAGQQVLLFYPQQGMVYSSQDAYCRQELFGHFVSPCRLGDDMQSSFCQSSTMNDTFLFDKSSMDFPVQPDVLHFGSQEEHDLIEKVSVHGISEKSRHCGGERPLESEREQRNTEKLVNSSMKRALNNSWKTSEVEVTKKSAKKFKQKAENEVIAKAPKRSKKISEFEATRVNAKYLKSKLPNINSIDSFGFSMDHSIKDKRNPLVHQDEAITLRDELFLESVIHEDQHEKSFKMEAKRFLFAKAQYLGSDFSESLCTRFSGNSLNPHHDINCGEVVVPDPCNNKEMNAVEKAKLCMNRRRKIKPNCLFKSSDLLDGEAYLKTLHNQSSDVALIPTHGFGVPEVEKTVVRKRRGRKKLEAHQNEDDNLSSSAITKTQEMKSYSRSFSNRGKNTESKAYRKPIKCKGHRRLVAPSARRGMKSPTCVKRARGGARSVLYWLIEMGVISLNDIIQYQSPQDNSVIKEGRVMKDGIFCCCCHKTLPVSDFKLHAGIKAQKPTLDLFLKSGKPYALCQLEAWAAEFKVRKDGMHIMKVDDEDQNDDTCWLCGDGGELVCCESCPSTYHQACLYLQELPEGSWYCRSCTCAICGDFLNKTEASDCISTIECLQCERQYHGMCIKDRIKCAEMGTSAWFCGKNCLEIYIGLRSIVGVTNCIDNEFSWTFLRCSHDDNKVRSAENTALMAECNTKLAIALVILEECFLPMLDPKSGIDIIPCVLYNCWSKFARLNYQGFYTAVLEKGDELISVASIRVHGVAVAEMPLISTCYKHRLKGMCRRLLRVIEQMLQSLKVEMLVVAAIPELIDTWISSFGFKLISTDDKQRLSNVHLMLLPGTILLKKDLYGCAGSESVEEKDSYSEALNSYKSSLGDLYKVNISSDTSNTSKDHLNASLNEKFQFATECISGSTEADKKSCSDHSYPVLPQQASAITVFNQATPASEV